MRSVVDVGCGDWQSSHLIDWGEATYLGLDVVPSVIEANKRKYGPRYQFRLIDGSTEELPPADLVILKDVLQHWPNAKVLELLPKLKAYRYAMITNGIPAAPGGPAVNSDIPMTGYRPLDIRKAPFYLPARRVAQSPHRGWPPENPPNMLVLLHKPQR